MNSQNFSFLIHNIHLWKALVQSPFKTRLFYAGAYSKTKDPSQIFIILSLTILSNNQIEHFNEKNFQVFSISL